MTATKIQPVAEICSASHDDAQFGERAIKPLCDISGFEYGTPLYAGAAPAAVVPQGEYPPLPSNTAHVTRRIRRCESEPTAQIVLEHAMHAYFDLGRQPAAVAGPALDVTLDEDQAGLLRDMLGHQAEYPEAIPVRLLVGDGRSGHGLYVAQAEYQDEGAFLLASLPAQAAPAAPAVDAIDDTALLDAMQRHRIALVPEFEGPWDAELYEEGEEPQHIASGATPREALRAAIAAQAKKGGEQ